MDGARRDAEERDAALGPAGRIRAIVAGSAGNLIEWYDFYVYAFTALYFSAAFFPQGDRTAQLLATAGIYAGGFFMRPVGGWYFGRFADRHGRRAAMVASIMMMSTGALLIAVLPGHASIGVAAPALLLVGRLVQGFSTGGQYGTAATYLSEIAFAGRRGFHASFQYVTLIGGQVLALAVILVLQAVLGPAAMAAYGWRIAFAIGAVAALGVLLLRGAIHETAAPRPGGDAGTLAALRPHWRGVLTVIGLTAGGSLSFYVFTTYMQKYLVNTAHLPVATVNWVMGAVLVPFMLLQPVLGALSDRIGRRANLLLFGALATAFTWPLLSLLGRVGSAGAAFALVLAGLAINAFYTSISGLFKAELFPGHVRALGVGLSYGIGNALFGGTAEYVALWFKQAGHESGFYWYATAIGAVSLLTALVMRSETRGESPLDRAAA